MKMKQLRQDEPCFSGKYGSFCIRIASIYYVEVLSHTVTVHTQIGTFSFHGSLAKVARELPEDRFFKCSQSYLINLSYTEPMNDTILLVGGDQIPLARSRKHEFWKCWEDHNF